VVDPIVLTVVGLLKKPDDPVVILGDGRIEVALTVKAHRFSKSAREKIEKAGGEIEIIPLNQ
jgi:large subunit ribosomal protein L15